MKTRGKTLKMFGPWKRISVEEVMKTYKASFIARLGND